MDLKTTKYRQPCEMRFYERLILSLPAELCPCKYLELEMGKKIPTSDEVDERE